MGENVKLTGRGAHDAIVGFSMLFLGLLIAAKLQQQNSQVLTGRFVVIDGDTLVVDGLHIRLEGIDAPEIGQMCHAGGQVTACGDAARRRLAVWAALDKFACVGEDRDRYNRLLVRCRVGDTNVNAAMVREGRAVAYGDYMAEEAAARRDGNGIWAGDFQRPQDWRREKHLPAAGESYVPAGFWAFVGRWLGVN
ncbi:succinoglycan biosynthesis protein [Ciceribacter naphthalenivorans]|uniref:Succinoglycan biosynthesis protein n=3 Tax=Pseudomonadota TaxID=1224 RepID=A0A512HCC1_9HYPH|nr:succinoglycan biosynthesis protein [Ciceribacter naphthalenivorans]GLR20514.1 succinoglycan biosynthesis protein [Ciceribacter naphthalenivorans]GLT03370.1 succinoglycan biosynthesis protein [Sphingomonas psychrolutea]